MADQTVQERAEAIKQRIAFRSVSAAGPEKLHSALAAAKNRGLVGGLQITKAETTNLASQEFDHKSLIETMRDSIGKIDKVPVDFDYSTLDARLAICESCPALWPDGCSNCSSCSTRWIGWRKFLVGGACTKFSSSIEAKYQPGPKGQEPQRKVNGMFVYLYQAQYVTPESPAKRVLRVIAPDLKSVIATVESTVPSASVVGAPAGTPIDAIASGVVPADVQVSPTPAPDQSRRQVPMMGPGGMPMIMGPGGPMPVVNQME